MPRRDGAPAVLNYIGSKWTLLAEIDRVLDENQVPRGGAALDLFAGSGVVSRYLKERGHTVFANDWQQYAAAVTSAQLLWDEGPRFTGLQRSGWAPDGHLVGEPGSAADPVVRVLGFLNRLPGVSGAFTDAYCQGGSAGRLYFSQENGSRIQAIRDRIAEWSLRGWITATEEQWLVGALVHAADQVANTASVYGAFLKRLKPSAARRLLVAPLGGASVPSEARPHRVTCCDSLRGLESLGDARLTLAYLDPPYNARQYSTNYHLLETIARWDLSTFRPRGFTGLRPAEELRSDFCRRGTVRHAFSAVFERLQSDWVLFSYNDEGLVPEAELLALISDRYELVTVERSPYRRFRADQDHAARKYARSATHELLILARSPAARVATRSPGSRELHTGPN